LDAEGTASMVWDGNGVKNILVVGDNTDILKALQAGIGCHVKGCTVLTALNGEQGNEIMRSRRIDMIIADLDMPAMNGYHFIETAHSERPLVPLCVITANGSESMDRLHALGVKRRIQKPFQFEDLEEAIRGELHLVREHA